MAKDSLACSAYPDPEEDCHGDLEHISEIAVRAMLPTTKLRPCAGCGGKVLGRDLYEVMGRHESLTFFEGDALCRACAQAHSVLRRLEGTGLAKARPRWVR